MAMVKCGDCPTMVRNSKSRIRCGPCRAVERVRYAREYYRKKAGFGLPVVPCRVCGVLIKDRGPKGNKRVHNRCLDKRKARALPQVLKRLGRVRLQPRAVIAEILVPRKLQQLSPEKFIRMVGCMRPTK